MDIEELVTRIDALEKKVKAMEKFMNHAFHLQTSGFDKIATVEINDEGRIELKPKE